MHLNQSLETWRALDLLGKQFVDNCMALEQRDAPLAQRVRAFAPMGEYMLRREQERLVVGRKRAGAVETVEPSITPVAAREALKRIYPERECNEPALVAGVDQGWLWQALHQMPCRIPTMPGHQPPLFFLCRQLESLWLAMHLHDWQALLSDPRVYLLFGDDAVDQVQRLLVDRPDVPWPKFTLTLDPGMWGKGQNVESLRAAVNTDLSAQLQRHMQGVERLDTGFSPIEAARRFRQGGLRIMGVTSRYTTFLQYSMRDWLNGFDALGHKTHLLIENSDHEVSNNLSTAKAVDEFQPDLVLLIDHYRAEIGGLPQNIPCAMWIQDLMPHLLSGEAGAKQNAYDYTLGYGRPIFSGKHGYPHARFMPSMLGVNENRFARAPIAPAELEDYVCDLSFVSHASTPADVLLQNQLATSSPQTQRVLRDIYDRLVAVYDAGGCVAEPLAMEKIIIAAMRDLAVETSASSRGTLSDLFVNKINNALFRHQALQWAADMGLDLRLYGRGWEAHPTLSKYARGIADNQTQLAAIYRASRINLHLTPHGAVHQRVLDGLCAGGFFLMRYRPGDAAAIHYRPILEWARLAGITTDAEFQTRAPSGVWRIVKEAAAMREQDMFHLDHSFMEELNLLADSEYTLAGATLWDEYFDVAFNSCQELQQRVEHYLSDDTARQQTVEAMRRPVLEKLTYRHIGQRLLNFIASDLERQAAVRQAA
jgi:hypothetical protein